MTTPTNTATQAAVSVLAALADAFTSLGEGADPVAIDCAPYADAGLPPRWLLLRELRDWLLAHPHAYQARDLVWRELLIRARRDAEWMTATIGMALPALIRAAGQLACGYAGDIAELDAEIVAGFIGEVHCIDLDRQFLSARLCRAAIRAGVAARSRARLDQPVPHVDALRGAAPQMPWGHPDLIVASAVTLGVIDQDDADVIVATRLDTAPVEQVAARLGLTPAALRMRRLRAETALVEAIRDGDLTGPLSPARPRTARSQPAIGDRRWEAQAT